MKKSELKAYSLLLGSIVLASCAHRAAPPGPPLKETKTSHVQSSSLSASADPSLRSELKPGQVLYIPISEKASKSADLWGPSRSARALRPQAKVRKADESVPASGERSRLYAQMRQLHWPLDGRLSSGFGFRSGRRHEGIDIMAPRGREIEVVHPGVVESAGWRKGYGWTVVVKHRGFKTLYAHCSKILVKKGQNVSRGQAIAEVGASGNAEGTHLHFEYMTLAGKSLDPLPQFQLTQNIAH